MFAGDSSEKFRNRYLLMPDDDLRANTHWHRRSSHWDSFRLPARDEPAA